MSLDLFTCRQNRINYLAWSKYTNIAAAHSPNPVFWCTARIFLSLIKCECKHSFQNSPNWLDGQRATLSIVFGHIPCNQWTQAPAHQKLIQFVGQPRSNAFLSSIKWNPRQVQRQLLVLWLMQIRASKMGRTQIGLHPSLMRKCFQVFIKDFSECLKQACIKLCIFQLVDRHCFASPKSKFCKEIARKPPSLERAHAAVTATNKTSINWFRLLAGLIIWLTDWKSKSSEGPVYTFVYIYIHIMRVDSNLPDVKCR